MTVQHKDQARRCTGKSYPHRRCDKCWIYLRDLGGREVLRKENVIFTYFVMEGWWNMVGEQQRANVGEWWLEGTTQPASRTFLHFSAAFRVIRDEDESCLEAQVPEALEKEAGWRFNEHGLLIGSLLTSRFVYRTVIPEVEESPELMRRGGR